MLAKVATPNDQAVIRMGGFPRPRGSVTIETLSDPARDQENHHDQETSPRPPLG
jgi:hypothetical protein